MTRYIFDVEADGFLDDATRVHCLVLQDIDTGAVVSCHDQHPEYPTIAEGLDILAKADLIVAHNGIKYDCPLLDKLYGFKPRGTVRDTLVLCRLIYSNIDDRDGVLHKQGKLPGKLFGSHSLEAWGYRLDHPKIGLDIEDWSVWTQNMEDRCVNDVALTRKLYLQLPKYDERCVALEHEVATLCAQMERNGFPFDQVKAVDLYAKLCFKRTELEQSLRDLFPAWYAEDGEFIPRKDNPKLGYTAGAPLTKVKLTQFNPASRHHIANRLKAKYGWKPAEFTQSGDAKVDEGILAALPYPEAKAMSEYMLIQKRIGQIAEGDQAWLKLLKDGRIHGSVNTCGAVTGRATHSHPNIAQVPRVGSPYGKECRELFVAPPGWVLVGSDLSGIELRGLAHYLARYDGGAYCETVLKGDPHTRHMQAAELTPDRTKAKTFGYAYLYGAGDTKLGTIVDPTANPKKARQIGKAKRALFQAQLTGLGPLQEKLKETHEQQRWLRGLDGRKLHVRSDHAALNTLLQSFGAVIAKQWIVLIEQRLTRDFDLKHGWDGDYALVAWVHDEVQIACKVGVEHIVSQACVDAARVAGEYFSLRIPIAAEAKIGNHWASTH